MLSLCSELAVLEIHGLHEVSGLPVDPLASVSPSPLSAARCEIVVDSAVTPSSYPESIPTDTPIPAWAYEPLGDDGHVNLQLALQVANQHQPDETVSGSYQETQPSPTATPSPPNPSPPANTIQVTTTSEGRSVQRTTSVTTSTSTQGPGNAGSPAQAPPPTGSLSTRIDEPSSNPPSVRSTGSTPPAAPSITLSPERTSQNKDPTSSNGAALSGGATPADETPHSTSIAGAADSSPRRSGDLASILGGVFGALAAVAVAIALVYWLVRRRRLRREKEAMLMCPPLDWWKQPEFPHPWPGHELSESATIKTENSDFDDMETLHATSMEKKSVTYGEYPDI
ncbi:hypothetical protein C8Q77DRAFT_382387 [Trametes polyzona]|nr:hypothetical protein C8Q77DRAFT_382387 [Trametes polyzona]